MRLNLNVIREQLSAECSILNLYLPEGAPAMYTFPQLYRPGTSFSSGKLYIADSCDLPKEPWIRQPIGLITIGEAPEAYILQNCSVLCLEKNMTSAVLFALVSEIFWKFQRWDTKLHKLLSTQSHLQKYIDLTYPFLKDPIWLCSSTGKVLAHFEEGEESGRSSETSFNGFITAFDEVMENSNLNLTLRSREGKTSKLTAYSQGKNWPALMRKLENERGERLGLLVHVEKDHPLDHSSEFIINYLGDILERALSNMSELSGRQLWAGNPLFKDILEQTPMSQSEFDHRLTAQGLENHRFCCIRLVLQQDNLNYPAESFCWHINTSIKDVHAMVYDSSIVLFLILPPECYSIKQLPPALKSILENGNFCAGVSHTFSALLDARYYYLQACSALELGLRTDPEKTCYFFKDYAMLYIMDRSLSVQPARTLCMEGIKRLQDIDSRNGSEYCRTLRLYFENGMNLQQTASDLFIHRSTLSYRLEKIEKYIGIELNDYQNRLYAMISLELLEK